VGTVDVTVQATAGKSEVTPHDHFTYLKPAEQTGKREQEEKEQQEKEHNQQNNQSSNNTSGGSSNGQSGGGQGQLQVLPAGPLHVQGCGATLMSKKIVVQQSKLALFKLLGTGSGSCSGKLRLRVKLKLGHKLVLKTIGTAVFSISTGRRVTVKVTLTRIGRGVLIAHHGKLNANLLIVKSLPLPALAQIAGVHLAPQPPKHTHKA